MKKLIHGAAVGVQILLKFISGCAFFVAASLPAHAGLLDIFGLGGSDGKIAKIDFRLRDSYEVTSLAWSPDGKYIVTGSMQSSALHVWDVEKKKIIKEFKGLGHAPGFHIISFSPDNKFLAFCTWNGSTAIYKTSDWSPIAELNPEKSDIVCSMIAPAFSSDSSEMATLGPMQLTVLSTKDWRTLKSAEFRVHFGGGRTGTSISYIPNSHDLAIAGQRFRNIDGKAEATSYLFLLKPQDTVPSEEFQILKNGSDPGSQTIERIAFSPDGNTIALGVSPLITSPPSTMWVFSWPGLKLAARSPDDITEGSLYGLSYTADGKIIVMGHTSNPARNIYLFDSTSFKIIDRMESGGPILDLATDPSNSARFAATSGKSVLVWKIKSK